MQDAIYYVQLGRLGYLSDNDYDGDWFTRDLMHAMKRTEPWKEGRAGEIYQCQKIKVSTVVFNGGVHETPRHKSFVSQRNGRTRYKAYCRKCGLETKDYASIANADAAFALEIKSRSCKKQIATVIEDV